MTSDEPLFTQKPGVVSGCGNLRCAKCYTQPIVDVVPEVRGLRYNKGKPMYCGPSSWSELEVAKVYAFGAEKHKDPVTGESGRNNWQKGLSYEETVESVLRHLGEFRRGKRIDEESKLHVLAHAIFGLQVLIHFDEFAERYKQFDDRVKP